MVNWFSRFITSSIGQKIIMSLTGLFLITFLLVHLIGNLQLMSSDGGQSFNEYAYFMTHNPLIKTVSYGLYAFILLHAIQGIVLWRRNSSARGSVGYAVKKDRVAGDNSRVSSVYMGALGTVILIFILIHMYQFWLQMKLGNTEMITYGDGEPVKDLYTLVSAAYDNVLFVVFYVVSMIFIAFHLWHGFQSAFQTLGLNHPKWTPLIKTVGKIYSVAVPVGFAAIPIYMHFFQ
ncbi:succinate dehydrogenase [Lewinellaceae bacterium SD302]|nr:succinate dehydrogenase [Lewinellaceae bacterium SD302]